MVFVASLIPLGAQTASNRCDANPALADLASGPAWNGWGEDISNSRFQSAAQLKAAQESLDRLQDPSAAAQAADRPRE